MTGHCLRHLPVSELGPHALATRDLGSKLSGDRGRITQVGRPSGDTWRHLEPEEMVGVEVRAEGLRQGPLGRRTESETGCASGQP